MAHIGAQIADALAVLDANGIVHRDVKPGNILVAADGTAKLTDFGISRWTEATLTQTGAVAWTPAYGAPEVGARKPATSASDVFALGATLFHAVEGKLPFDGAISDPRRGPAYAVLTTQRAGPLAPVLSRLLAFKPAERPNAAQARDMLRTVADESTRHADGEEQLTVALGPAKRVRARKPHRRKALVAGIGILTDPVALRPFGQTRVDPDFGNFNRCDVLVTTAGQPTVDVQVELQMADVIGDKFPPDGSVAVEKLPLSDDGCVRRVRRTPPVVVAITTKIQGKRQNTTDLCQIGDVATESVAGKFGSTGVPRRSNPFPPTSLANVSACGLLDANALSGLPDIDATNTKAGFGDWECRWLYQTTGATAVFVRFSRGEPENDNNAATTRIGGYDAVVKPQEAPDNPSCDVTVVYLPYADVDGKQKFEQVRVTTYGAQPIEQLCTIARDLSMSAAAKLPGR